MLFTITLLVDGSAMAITLWLAFYLLGRGFPSQITLRAVITLLALSLFFFSAFINLFQQIEGATAQRAVLLVVGLATWYGLTYQLLGERSKKRLVRVKNLIYVLSGITGVLLISTPSFVGEKENMLWVGRMGVGPPYIVYGVFQVLVCSGILYNLLTDDKIGLKPQGRFLLLASLFPITAVGYGVLALAITPPMPRLVQDLLIFSGVFLLSLSIARYQILVERRTTLHDLPLSGLTLLSLSAIYALAPWRLGSKPEIAAAAMMLAIMTHSIYDLAREYIERQRTRKESAFRHKLHQLEGEVSNQEGLQHNLQEGLDLLCHSLNASGGFIAVRQKDAFVVSASHRSLPLDCHIPSYEVECEDIAEPTSEQLAGISWIAPAFEADRQAAVIGIAAPKNRLNYSADDLDLLGEVAERIGTIVSLSIAQPTQAERLKQLEAAVQSDASNLRSRTDEMMAAMTTQLDPELVKMVEEGLRQLHDYISLGQLTLADCLEVSGDTHVERGKGLQQILIDSIRVLRPPGPRPEEPLPRVWYNYAILHDAYVECVPNREIMARLYISEGTFNRTRRNALRGLTRLIVERQGTLLKA